MVLLLQVQRELLYSMELDPSFFLLHLTSEPVIHWTKYWLHVMSQLTTYNSNTYIIIILLYYYYPVES